MAASLISGTGAAQADEIEGQGVEACPEDLLCLYENSNFNSGKDARILMTNLTIADLGDWNFDDTASSYVNNTESSVILYSEPDFKGKEDLAWGASQRAQMGPFVGDNEVSSLLTNPAD